MESIDDVKKERELVLIQILYLFIIPTLLFYFKIIPGDFRFFVLFVIGLLLFGIVHHAKWTYKDMGVNRDFMKDIIPYSLFTVAGVLFLVWLAQIVSHYPFMDWWKDIKFLALFAPISVIQEIVYRGIMMKMLSRVFSNPVFIIFINSIVFAFMHVIYLNSMFVLPMTFIAGVGFAWMYYKYENLILISASHTVLNFVAMILGFFIIR